jgi:hypothetical protein
MTKKRNFDALEEVPADIVRHYSGTSPRILYASNKGLRFPVPFNKLDIKSLSLSEITETINELNEVRRLLLDNQRFGKLVKKLEGPRNDGDYTKLFPMRYSSLTIETGFDSTLQQFLRGLPLGAFAKIVCKLSSNDLKISADHGNLARNIGSPKLDYDFNRFEDLEGFSKFLVEVSGRQPIWISVFLH